MRTLLVSISTNYSLSLARDSQSRPKRTSRTDTTPSVLLLEKNFTSITCLYLTLCSIMSLKIRLLKLHLFKISLPRQRTKLTSYRSFTLSQKMESRDSSLRVDQMMFLRYTVRLVRDLNLTQNRLETMSSFAVEQVYFLSSTLLLSCSEEA